MEQTQETSLIPFESLPMIQPLSQQLVGQMDQMMQGSWHENNQCITALRSINRFCPESSMEVVSRYLTVICDLISNGKTQVVKNVFMLIREIFARGKMLNVEKCVLTFVGLLIKKVASEHGHIQKLAREALDDFVGNCGYDISFVSKSVCNVVVAEYSCDKNASVSEVAIKLLARLLQNLGASISQLKPETLQKVMRALAFLLEGKRQSNRNWGLEICMFIFSLIGSSNYYSLMTYVLTNEEMQAMTSAMNNYKKHKSKEIVPLASVIKERRTMFGGANMHNENLPFNGNPQQGPDQNGMYQQTHPNIMGRGSMPW